MSVNVGVGRVKMVGLRRSSWVGLDGWYGQVCQIGLVGLDWSGFRMGWSGWIGLDWLGWSGWFGWSGLVGQVGLG